MKTTPWKRSACCAAFVALCVLMSITAATSRAAVEHSTTKIPAHTFVDLVSGVPTGIDPLFAQGIPSAALVPTFASPLVRQKGTKIGTGKLLGASAVVPFLATSWKTAKTGSITFQLRHGVKSPAGNEFTSADVVYSFDRMEALGATPRFLMQIANFDQKNLVTTHGKYSFTLNAKAPSAIALGILTWNAMTMYDSKLMKDHATAGDPWSKTWLATHSAYFGAYQVDGFAPGQTIDLKASPGYWAKPYFTHVVIRAIVDPSTRLQVMLSGGASHTLDLTWGQFATVAKSGSAKGVLAQVIQSCGQEDLLLNEKFAPFANKRVRQAINMAIDRNEIVKAVYKGYGTPDFSQAPASLAVPTKIKTKFDVSGAKKLLAQAGYPNGFSFTLSAGTGNTGAYITDVMALVQSQLAKIGITASINPIASVAEFNSDRAGKRLQGYLTIGTPAIADAGYFLDHAYSTASTISYESYNNPQLEKFFNVMLGAAAGPRHDRALSAAVKIIADDVPGVAIDDPPVQSITDKTIKGYLAYAYPVTYYDTLHR